MNDSKRESVFMLLSSSSFTFRRDYPPRERERERERERARERERVQFSLNYVNDSKRESVFMLLSSSSFTFRRDYPPTTNLVFTMPLHKITHP